MKGPAFGNRTWSTIAEGRSLFARDEASDEKLQVRIRKIGRLVSNAGAIEVTVHDGKVALRNPVLEHEKEALFGTVASERGIKDVDDQLNVPETAEGIPGLQHQV